MKHFTMTGVYAGSTFCLSYFAQMGAGSSGERNSSDQYAHYAYAPESWLTAPDLCADCKHVADCEADTCDDCHKLGWSDK